MDEKASRVLIDGKDQSASIKSIRSDGYKYFITYKSSDKEYSYSRRRVEILPWDPEEAGDEGQAEDFGTGSRTAREKAAGMRTGTVSLLDYFRETAEAVGLVSDSGENLLGQRYQTLAAPRKESALYSYLHQDAAPRRYAPQGNWIYPFGLNLSQKAAVEQAFSSQVSIIQGPPGTGKTQTILNIIANVLVRGGTVAVVSNNNSAVQNVAEKLEKKGLSFLTASLGSQSNTRQFLDSQLVQPPDVAGWRRGDERALVELPLLMERMESLMDDERRLAQLRQEQRELYRERAYVLERFKGVQRLKFRMAGISSREVMCLLLLCEDCLEDRDLYKWGEMLKNLAALLTPEIIAFLAQYPEQAASYMERWYYAVRIREIEDEIKALAEKLNAASFPAGRRQLELRSFQALLNQLSWRYAQYSGDKEWQNFDKWMLQKDPAAFTAQYPVVLSTAYTIRGALGQAQLGSGDEYLYDYLIIDEASQVDLATGVLAFSCAKNVVIVGDLQQMPFVCSRTKEAEAVWKRYRFPEMYRYTKHSLLSSAIQRWADAPVTLLREHYRCHPRIIDFCNRKFYGGLLLPMTLERGEEGVLSLYLTKPNQSGKGHVSQNQIDVILDKILPDLEEKGYEGIGIITPYRDQVQAVRARVGDRYEAATVHQFQGREKEAIILSSVDNELGAFVDDPNMLNVAVSRAVRSLSVVTSSAPGNDKTNYGDLVRYIRYHTGACTDGPLYPAPAYMLREKMAITENNTAGDLLSILCKAILNMVGELLEQAEFSWLGCAFEVNLDTILRDRGRLNEEEREYALKDRGFVRFLLYHQMDKAPLGAIDLATSEDNAEDIILGNICRKYGIAHLLVSCRPDADGGEAYVQKFIHGKKPVVREFLRTL